MRPAEALNGVHTEALSQSCGVWVSFATGLCRLLSPYRLRSRHPVHGGGGARGAVTARTRCGRVSRPLETRHGGAARSRRDALAQHPGDVARLPAQARPGLLDWTDYGRRVTGQDPTALAQEVAPAHANLWLVTASGYARFADRCQRLLTALDRNSGPGQRMFREGDRPRMRRSGGGAAAEGRSLTAGAFPARPENSAPAEMRAYRLRAAVQALTGLPDCCSR